MMIVLTQVNYTKSRGPAWLGKKLVPIQLDKISRICDGCFDSG